MFPATDLPKCLAVFPIPKAVLFPRAKLPLLIFEPRYLAMLDDVLKSNHRLIGMVQPDGDDGALHRVGCAGRLTKFSENEDGRYGITLTGISRFRITTEKEGFTPYRSCEVLWQEFSRDLGGAEHDAGLSRSTLISQLKRYFKSRDMQTDWDIMAEAPEEMMLNSVAMLCPFDVVEKQALLEAPDLTERRKILETLLEYACRGGEYEGKMQ